MFESTSLKMSSSSQLRKLPIRNGSPLDSQTCTESTPNNAQERERPTNFKTLKDPKLRFDCTLEWGWGVLLSLCCVILLLDDMVLKGTWRHYIEWNSNRGDTGGITPSRVDWTGKINKKLDCLLSFIRLRLWQISDDYTNSQQIDGSDTHSLYWERCSIRRIHLFVDYYHI